MVGCLHWSATYFFCLCLIGVIITSDLLVTPYLLSLKSQLEAKGSTTKQQPPETTIGLAESVGLAEDGTPPEPIDQETAAATTVSTLASIPSGEALERTVYIESEPFATSNPFLFELLTQSAVMLLLPFIYTFEYIWNYIGTALNLPDFTKFRDKIKRGHSILGQCFVYISEQFDNVVINENESSPTTLLSVLYLGLVTLALLLHTYLWKVSLIFSSHSFCTLVSYSHVLFAFPLVVVILKDTRHGLKIVPAVISFIGLYIFFFPEPATTTYSVAATFKATGLAIGSGLLFSLYLVCYRLLSPCGWMMKVIGLQGLGLFIFGSMIEVALHFSGIEPFALPSTKFDILTIAFSSISRFFILYCINEALRWGDPLTVAVSLCLSAPTTFAIKSFYATDDSAMMTHSKLASLAICVLAFSMLATHQLQKVLHAVSQPYTPKRAPGNPQIDRKDGSPDETTPLRTQTRGSEYTV